jgi:hypothetical protein
LKIGCIKDNPGSLPGLLGAIINPGVYLCKK